MESHEAIMFWAFRYALGRHTYAVSDVSDYLIRNKADIGGATRALICREITEHFAKHGDTEWDCDRDSWFSVISALSPQNTDKP